MIGSRPNTPAQLKTVSRNQTVILRNILSLTGLEAFDVDVTYGHGAFYRHIPEPWARFDLDPQVAGVVQADSTCLPLPDSCVRSVVFDPPFLTYIRQGRTGNAGMVMARRFGGYWTYEQLVTHYRESLREAARVLTPGGWVVVKCQDIVHNHRLTPTHTYVIEWAGEHRLTLQDLFVLPATTSMMRPNTKGTQKHARIAHSYFLLFNKMTDRQHKVFAWGTR